MTPAARVQSAAEILDAILSGAPAEQALTRWARRNRFAGSGDRAAIRDHVFDVLRRRRSCAALGGGDSGRALMLGLLRQQGAAPDTLFDGSRHGPAVLSEAEKAMGRRPGADEALDLPDWLIAAFRDGLGPEAVPNACALRERAPLHLRVNLRKTTVAQARRALSAEEVETRPLDLCDSALEVLTHPRRVSATAAYRDGLVEIQDASSQAAMALVPLRDRARVLDFCAGGGGKTLALAGRTDGVFHAHDAAPRRMVDLPARAARAGVEVTCLETPALSAQAPYDLVLCDAPCSGSGAWRRNPAAKWTLTPSMLAELQARQAAILDTATAHVVPGGVLAYATCSLLAGENDRQVDAFEARHPGFTCVLRRSFTLIDGCDGFFLALLERTI